MCAKIWSELIGDYERVYGNGMLVTQLRGFVQITWKENYEKYNKILKNRFPEDDIDIVNNPDQSLDFKYALLILVDGFKHGRFTGKKISDYINPKKVDFRNARRCINGLDRARDIAKLAKKYL